MAGEDSELEKMSSELAGTHFTIRKKNSDKIKEFKRSGIGLIAEFCGIPNGFPNLGNDFSLPAVACNFYKACCIDDVSRGSKS
jgi:hypothetical protein